MALLNIFDIAGSALTAQSKRLNVAASNLANADSVTGPDGQPYRAKQVVFQVDAAPGAATGGVKVADVVESQAPDKLVYEPGNPLADASGYVKMPNVDVVHPARIIAIRHTHELNNFPAKNQRSK